RRRADRAHQRDILLVAVIVVVGDIAVLVVLDPPRRVREPIPDRLALTVLVPRALDLIRGCPYPPKEPVRKATTGRHGWCLRSHNIHSHLHSDANAASLLPRLTANHPPERAKTSPARGDVALKGPRAVPPGSTLALTPRNPDRE